MFAKLGLDEADYQSAEAVVEVLLKHPKLMQRPIVLTAQGAVIGRPKDRVNELLDRS